MKILLYCCKAKPYLLCEPYMDENKPCRLLRKDLDKTIYNCVKENAVNGKIVAECDYEVEGIRKYLDNCYNTETLGGFALQSRSCLNAVELDNYLKNKNGYAIHIKNLHIFGKPRELSDYEYVRRVKGEPTLRAVLFEAPKNMRKVIANGTNAILMSIKPQLLCKILNREKTIEVRKKVLKEMI